MSFIRIVPTPRIPFITMNWSTKSNLTITVELILITLISILETALSDDHAYLYDVHRTTRPFALSDLYNPKYHTWTNIDETEEETDSMSCTIRMACGDDLVSEEGIVETDSVDGCRQACARSLAKCRYFTWFSEGVLGGRCFKFRTCKKFVLKCQHCHTGTTDSCSTAEVDGEAFGAGRGRFARRPRHIRTFLN